MHTALWSYLLLVSNACTARGKSLGAARGAAAFIIQAAAEGAALQVLQHVPWNLSTQVDSEPEAVPACLSVQHVSHEPASCAYA